MGPLSRYISISFYENRPHGTYRNIHIFNSRQESVSFTCLLPGTSHFLPAGDVGGELKLVKLTIYTVPIELSNSTCYRREGQA